MSESPQNSVPELEFGKAADKRPKLVGSADGEGGPIHEFLQLRVHPRGQEPDQESHHVESEGVCHNVEPFDEVDAEGVGEGDCEEGDPAAEHVRYQLVEEVTVPLRHGKGPP